ncbi:hypothetical protein LDL76_12495 [Salegentibacter mishustinae]|uniref:DUF6998 domain-containing protein n=1 Tax=Salegentibacter mishustinae TaxID=270918 RepID=UPI001CE1B3C3|nr:hypothetical protein [Salegentibacter mishustinae]UBZ06177.1 hypothetical protein LDL76_12495 [Salegentibacter mishustinae]
MGIISTDSFTGEIGEFFACEYFNLKKSNRSNKAVDGISSNGERFQIKSKIVKQNKFNYNFSKLQSDLFDQLAIIYFDKFYNPIKILLIPSNKIKEGKISIAKSNISTFKNFECGEIKISKKKKDAINDFALAYNRLKENNIIRTRHIVGDIGEIYACNKLNLLQNENKTQKGFDAVHENGLKFEIKSRRVYESGRRISKTRRINNLVGKNADYLIIVVLDRSFNCIGMWLIPMKNIVNPKSAKLEIVNNTKGTLNVVPSEISWLQTGEQFISFNQKVKTENNLPKLNKNERSNTNLPKDIYDKIFYLDNKEILILTVITIAILYVVGKLL